MNKSETTRTDMSKVKISDEATPQNATSGHQPSTFSKKAQNKEEAKIDLNLAIPDLPEDLLEMVKHIKTDLNKLQKVLTNDRLSIEDLPMFKDKLDDVAGLDTQSFIEYVSTEHLRHKDKYALKWTELYKILIQDWPIWLSLNRNKEKVEEWINEAEDDNEYYGLDEYDEHRVYEDDYQMEFES